MFLGHYAVALAAKKVASKTSFGTLILSAQFLDLLWPIFLLSGLEHFRIEPGNTAMTPFDFYDYPYSHSLLSSIGWGIGAGYLYYLTTKYTRGAIIIAIGVISHWVLDFITHRPDMPIIPGVNFYVGLGLWNSITATIALEGIIFVVGLFFYLKTTQSTDKKGTYGFWSLLVFLVIIWIANIFGPPPPGETPVAFSALLLWLLVPWGYWIDRHRNNSNVHTHS